MRAFLLVVGLVAGLVAAGAHAQSVEREAGPLPRFFPHRSTYLDLDPDQRSHFQLAYLVSSQSGVPADEIRMWFNQDDGEVISFDIDATGRITRLPDLDELSAEPTVWINQERGGMSLNLQFEATLPGGPDFAASDLQLALGQANHAIRQAAGVAALFAPNFKTLVFEFDGPAPTAIAIHDDGTTSALTAQENRVMLRPRDRAMRNLVRIELGSMPTRVLLDS
ncbi:MULTISPECIES: hypothetical protein [Maricaulis]|jgi:hypothetical protein|uniref:DUF2987 family protein n=1 Tax=Maricaulis maris (strain MCS10) TaxID=394221 RepID=Q0ALQ4_MARMM|nr:MULTISPECIES: hypothetical protein [Maricaulis]ABI66789.1 hypothetical protein Mmar10_2503 [Maricaulis maris MCS10]MAC88797.1 hypothetical protein [Maricaulis sp.]